MSLETLSSTFLKSQLLKQLHRVEWKKNHPELSGEMDHRNSQAIPQGRPSGVCLPGMPSSSVLLMIGHPHSCSRWGWNRRGSWKGRRAPSVWICSAPSSAVFPPRSFLVALRKGCSMCFILFILVLSVLVSLDMPDYDCLKNVFHETHTI